MEQPEQPEQPIDVTNPDDINYLQSLPYDVLEPILYDLSFHDLLKLCRVSKYFRLFCNDWDFWAYKAEFMYGFPHQFFENTDEPDPRQRFREIETNRRDPNTDSKIDKVMRENRLDVIKDLIIRGYKVIYNPIFTASMLGQFETVKYLFDAADVGLIPPPTQDDIDYSLGITALDDRLDLLEYIFSKGISNKPWVFQGAVRQAARHGQRKALDYLLSLKRKVNLNDALDGAASSNQIEMMKYLISLGATDLNHALRTAAHYGIQSLDAFQYLRSQGATDVNGALHGAIGGADLEMVQYIVEHTSANYHQFIDLAEKYADEDFPSTQDIVDYLKSLP